MVDFWEEKRTMVEEEEQVPLLENNENKGGFKTLPFIIANEAFEKTATFGLMPNMILYLTKVYHMEMTTASNVLFAWSAATNFMPLFGAIMADSYFGRFNMIGFGSVVCLMGMILLWSTTIIPNATPPPCEQSTSICNSVTIYQVLLLGSSFGLISIGAGAIGSCSLAFGANQLENEEFQRRPEVKQSYFSWYYASIIVSVLVALTCVVYVQDKWGWGIGFAVPALLMLLAVISFFLASPLYIKLHSKTNIITCFIQVVVASYKNRHLKLSDNTDFMYHRKNGSALVFPSRKLRFLNKACIVKDPHKNLNLDGETTDPWTLCTVDQVEELKALLRVLPIWSTGMIMSINLSQNSFPVLQATSMDRHITSGFAVPAASFNIFTVIAAIVWIVVYDRVFLPLTSLIKGRPVHLSSKARMGIGIFFSFLAMIVTAIVEGFRRGLTTKDGYLDNSQPIFNMSAMWLVPQYCLMGLAEASNVIAQNEFYFSELPRSMSSIALTLNGMGLFLANLIASFILNVVDSISRAGGGETWISTDINKGRYDYYYLVLASLSMANMMYFLVCSSAYGSLKEEQMLEEPAVEP